MPVVIRELVQESILSLYRVGPGDRTQVVRLGGKHLYVSSRLTSPVLLLFGERILLCVPGWPSTSPASASLLAGTKGGRHLTGPSAHPTSCKYL